MTRRKALIITMLLLMIMTSLNAGTLAIYTSTVELKAVPITAKRFVLDVGRGSADEFDLWIAPGDTVIVSVPQGAKKLKVLAIEKA